MNANIPNLHPTKFLSPSETRWLVTGKVIDSVIRQWHELTAYFRCIRYTKNYSSRSLLEMLNDRSNYLYLVFASPLINEFEQINVFFQHTNADQCRLFKDLDVFYISLRSRICRDKYVRMYEKIEDTHLKPITDILFGAKFYQELSESKLSNEQVLNIKHRCLNFLKTAVDEVSMRLPEKFKFFDTLQAFHPDVLLSQSRGVQFHELNLAEFCTSDENLDDLEKQYINIRLCDWTNAGIDQIDLNDQMNFWCNVYNFKNAAGVCCFRTLAKLVLNKLCLPISNAFVERVFSQAALAKTKVRNKMGHKLLKSILMIRSHLMLNNSCCKDCVVSEEMLKKFNSSMYDHDETNEGDTDNTEPDDMELMAEILQE